MGHRAGLFDWLRLSGALMVLFGHSYGLLGVVPPKLLGNEIHTLGVKLFFIISGYLIAGSWRADPNFWRYAVKRALRIMPALIVVVFATALVLGPILSTDANYPAGAWRYIWRNAMLLPLHVLPGVFKDNPLPAVNGSLWTLPVEVAMYVATPVLVRAGPWVCLFIAGALFAHPFTQTIGGFGLAGASSVIPWFFIGAALKMLGAALPKTSLPALPWDLSYGIYLMAFPAQQTIIVIHPGIGPLALALATSAVVVPLAALSWRFIERPAVMLVHHTGRPILSPNVPDGRENLDNVGRT